MAKNITFYGIYATRLNEQEAVDGLRSAGFRAEDISILVPENEGSKDLAVQKRTKAPEGLALGAIVGAVIGGVIGWLIAAGILVIPDIAAQNVLVLVVLAGVAIGGVLGGLFGARIGAGRPEYEAVRFEGRIRGRGGILLSVHCDNKAWAKKAHQVLMDTGAWGIGSAREARADYARSDRPLPRTRPETRLGDTRVVEEDPRHRAA